MHSQNPCPRTRGLLLLLCSRALNREHGTSSRKLNVAQRSTGRNIAISSSYTARRLCKLSRSVLQYLETPNPLVRVSKVCIFLHFFHFFLPRSTIFRRDSPRNPEHERRTFRKRMIHEWKSNFDLRLIKNTCLSNERRINSTARKVRAPPFRSFAHGERFVCYPPFRATRDDRVS